MQMFKYFIDLYEKHFATLCKKFSMAWCVVSLDCLKGTKFHAEKIKTIMQQQGLEMNKLLLLYILT